MRAPSQGTKISNIDQPAFAQPLSVWSPNMSSKQRNHTISAAIQMKNQKLHSMISQKLVVVSIATPLQVSAGAGLARFSHEFVRVGGTSAGALLQTFDVRLPGLAAQRIPREG